MRYFSWHLSRSNKYRSGKTVYRISQIRDDGVVSTIRFKNFEDSREEIVKLLAENRLADEPPGEDIFDAFSPHGLAHEIRGIVGVDMHNADEIPWVRQIIDSPEDIGLRLVFADWLEERGDPRCFQIRKKTELLAVPDAVARGIAVSMQPMIDRAKSDPFFCGAHLPDDETLRDSLGLDDVNIGRLRLCRYPNSDEREKAIVKIAKYVGCDAVKLTEVLW